MTDPMGGSSTQVGGWLIRRSSGPAGEFHDRQLAVPTSRAVWIHEVERPALVLGSTQPESVVDGAAAARAGVDVVRRRSGGGAVLVEPGGVVWVDVVIPAGDPRWDDDVGRAAHWVGGTWARALADLGISADVHRGSLQPTEWSRQVCFGGLGPGEVTVPHPDAGHAGRRKVVGLAQRRTRSGARFQTAALLQWEPDRLVSLLALDDAERRRAIQALVGAAAPLPLAPPTLVTGFLEALAGA